MRFFPMGPERLVTGGWGEADIGSSCPALSVTETRLIMGPVSPAFSHPSFPSLSFCPTGEPTFSSLWPLSTWNPASATEKLSFTFYLMLLNSNLKADAQFSWKLLSRFGIWVCESTFSTVNLMKFKHRSYISVENLVPKQRCDVRIKYILDLKHLAWKKRM